MNFDIWGIGKRRSLTPGDKNYLVRIAKGKCEYCGGDIIGKGIVPNIHHIVPFASGGSDREHNLIVLCPNCHTRVDHISRAELRIRIAYRLPKKASEQSVVAEKAAPKKAVPKKAVPKKAAPKKAVAKKTTARKK